MTATESREKLVGKRLKRREDPRLVQGLGRFMDDIVLPGMAHAKVLRSPVAHARINGIDSLEGGSRAGRDWRLHRQGFR